MKTIVFAGGLSLLGTLLGTRLAIRILVKKGYGQLIRDDGPTSHHVKRGTSTMGGLVIIAAVLAAYILSHLLTWTGPSASAVLILFLFTGLGAVGFLDDYIKIRKDAWFSERDIRMLEVHEGWVHVGTTLNGRVQPVSTFLSKGTPTTTITQEGLALFVEVISFSSHPARLRRVTDRIRAIRMAESGATFLDDLDMLLSAGGGHLVPVAMKHGVHVCWACGEPFQPESPRMRMVEKRIDGGTVPVAVHAKCISPRVMSRPFMSSLLGLAVRRQMADVVRRTPEVISTPDSPRASPRNASRLVKART